MTERARLKKVIRARMVKTGEDYMVARRALLDAEAAALDAPLTEDEEMAENVVEQLRTNPSGHGERTIDLVRCPRCGEGRMAVGDRQCSGCNHFDMGRRMGWL